MGDRPRDDGVARWRRVRALFDEAVSQPADARAMYLAKECVTEPDIRAEVEALLAADAATHRVLDATPDQLAGAVLGTHGGALAEGRRTRPRTSRPQGSASAATKSSANSRVGEWRPCTSPTIGSTSDGWR